MFRKFSNAMSRFMYGRNGMDALGVTMMVVSLVLLLAGSLWVPALSLPAFAVLLLCIWRCYSKKLDRRRQENKAFLRLTAPLRDRKNHYFRCPKCRQTVRVPRGKGRVAIRCPKCGERFERKA